MSQERFTSKLKPEATRNPMYVLLKSLRNIDASQRKIEEPRGP